MRLIKFIFKISISLPILCSSLFSLDFTVSSYNCGGLSDHYDYIRAVVMHKLVQERFNLEASQLSLLEKIENTALKILFSNDAIEKKQAEQEWAMGNYSEIFHDITTPFDQPGSENKSWNEKSEHMVTSYKERPVVLYDEEINQMLRDHIQDLVRGEEWGEDLNRGLDITRRIMSTRIFRQELNYDIIALQEADYLTASSFPEGYDVRFSSTSASINGVAWNKMRFELVEVVGEMESRGVVVLLRDLRSGEKVAIASAHLTGCNPFCQVKPGPNKKSDSDKGDKELKAIIESLEGLDAKIKIIAMDSNVTATHPRLSLLKCADYTLDYTNYLEPTCTNPSVILNTRIDWIALKSSNPCATIANIPVLGVGLNSPTTNISDHKPIAARVSY